MSPVCAFIGCVTSPPVGHEWTSGSADERQIRTHVSAGELSCSAARVPAVLVPYDPSWPDQFKAAAENLKQVGNSRWTVEHIGSTAIPGPSAKPIIDLAVCVENERDFSASSAGAGA